MAAPTSLMMIALALGNWDAARRTSVSSGTALLKLFRRTLTSRILPFFSPVTRIVAGYGLTTPASDMVMALALVKVLTIVFFLGLASASGVAAASGSARNITSINASTRVIICRLLFDVLLVLRE